MTFILVYYHAGDPGQYLMQKKSGLFLGIYVSQFIND